MTVDQWLVLVGVVGIIGFAGSCIYQLRRWWRRRRLYQGQDR